MDIFGPNRSRRRDLFSKQNSKEKTNDNTQSVKNEDDFKTPNSEDVDKEKKRKKQRRLSFADEHGQDLKEVSYVV